MLCATGVNVYRNDQLSSRGVQLTLTDANELTCAEEGVLFRSGGGGARVASTRSRERIQRNRRMCRSDHQSACLATIRLPHDVHLEMCELDAMFIRHVLHHLTHCLQGVPRYVDTQALALGPLASGTYADVYVAPLPDADADANTRVVVKRRKPVHNPHLYYWEVAALAAVCHPSVVKLYGLSTRPCQCILLEYVRGPSLWDRIHDRVAACYDLKTAVRWMEQLAGALAAVHDAGYVHRDVKSPNILVRDGRIVLIDFGHAMPVQHIAAYNTMHTAGWAIAHEPNSQAGDVYAFGVVCWELCTRRRPEDTLPDLAENDLCTNELILVIQPCLDSDPKKRPTARAVQKQLEQMTTRFIYDPI